MRSRHWVGVYFFVLVSHVLVLPAAVTSRASFEGNA
jgi:hypothetical protein